MLGEIMAKIYLISLLLFVLVFTACSNTEIIQENVDNDAETTQASVIQTIDDGRVHCTEESKTNFECRNNYEYKPVCSYFDSTIKCVEEVCSTTDSNKCDACLRPHVEYYIEGTCPLN